MTGAAVETVRAELKQRVAAIGAVSRTPRDLAREVNAIRAAARRAGLHPAVTVAHLVDDALSRGERGPLVDGWLVVLGEAVASERSDPAACDAFAAACAVRVG